MPGQLESQRSWEMPELTQVAGKDGLSGLGFGSKYIYILYLQDTHVGKALS